MSETNTIGYYHSRVAHFGHPISYYHSRADSNKYLIFKGLRQEKSPYPSNPKERKIRNSLTLGTPSRHLNEGASPLKLPKMPHHTNSIPEGLSELLIDYSVCEAEMISILCVSYEACGIAIAHEINNCETPSDNAALG